MKKIFSLIFLSFFVFSCKAPDFSTDEPIYGPGDLVSLTAHSTGKISYKWIFSNGEVKRGKRVTYTIPNTQQSGLMFVILETRSPIGIKSSTSKAIPIGGEGKVSFWTNGVGSRSVTVMQTTKYITSSSNIGVCGSVYNAEFTLEAGYYSYVATSGPNTYLGTFTVRRNGCTTVQIP